MDTTLRIHFSSPFLTFSIITDHNNVNGGTTAQQIAREKYADKIKVLVGEEYVCFLSSSY